MSGIFGRFNDARVKCPVCPLYVLPDLLEKHVARHVARKESERIPENHYPRTGAYGNDCPFCNTHNAIIERYPHHQCRDCKRAFELVNGATQWELLDKDSTRFKGAGL